MAFGYLEALPVSLKGQVFPWGLVASEAGGKLVGAFIIGNILAWLAATIHQSAHQEEPPKPTLPEVGPRWLNHPRSRPSTAVRLRDDGLSEKP
jgi:hypothetical protein